MLAWAGHLWAIVWLLNIELLPLVSLSTAAVVVLGALFLAGETLAIELLRRRLHRAGLDRIDSAGRRGLEPSDGPARRAARSPRASTSTTSPTCRPPGSRRARPPTRRLNGGRRLDSFSPDGYQSAAGD